MKTPVSDLVDEIHADMRSIQLSNDALTRINAELLEALEGLAACISETRGLPAHEALSKARAAIAKARGE